MANEDFVQFLYAWLENQQREIEFTRRYVTSAETSLAEYIELRRTNESRSFLFERLPPDQPLRVAHESSRQSFLDLEDNMLQSVALWRERLERSKGLEALIERWIQSLE